MSDGEQISLLGMETPPATFASAQQLADGLDYIRQAPADSGVIKMIVRRPGTEKREVITEAHLDPGEGLVGDNWRSRGSSRTPDRTAHPDMQLNLMNARAIELVAGSEDRWPLAGDQFYIDLDLSEHNLPPGTHLELGSATIEVTAEPHLGCQKFKRRFGEDAMKFVNSPEGRQLKLRGINAKVVQAGVVKMGDTARKLV